MEKFIGYFSSKHLLINFLVFFVFTGAVIFWQKTSKEDMPELTMDFLRITTSYPGASCEDVERFVTKEIEESLTGIDGIKEVSSTTQQGSSSIRISLEPNNPKRDEVVAEIEDAVAGVKLPDDVKNDPRIREFKSSKRAIADIMLIYNDVDIMSVEQRRELQMYADSLEDRLLRLAEVSEVSKSDYLNEQIEIRVKPEKLLHYNMSLSEIISIIKKNNIRKPAGSLENKYETKVTLSAELDTIEKIKNLIIRGNYEGQFIRLYHVADVVRIFKTKKSISKVNGSESVRLNVVKTSSAGIIKAMDEVKVILDEFSHTVLKGSNVKLVLLDDESAGVKNRLSLISLNGLVGFILILVSLLIFLNFRSAIWVAMGIPFTFGFTMIFAALMGQTINNMTLAAVIIVMGMVVDDAIVVAENVSRLISHGTPVGEAVIKGTAYVLLPIVASITTTCAAFVPLFFFQGRFGLMTRYLPPIIFLMLGGSLFEAVFILPSHLAVHFPRWIRVIFSLGMLPLIERHYRKKNEKKTPEQTKPKKHVHWFFHVEEGYGKILHGILRVKWLLFVIFIGLIIYAGMVLSTKMKFVMFPREETTSISLSGFAPNGTLKFETEKMVREVEAIFDPYVGKEVVGYRTSIARSRWGGAVQENRFSISIEIIPADRREKSANELIREWQKELDTITGFQKLAFSKGWFGHSSGTPIDISIKENNNALRMKIAEELRDIMHTLPFIDNPEIEEQYMDREYHIELNRDLITRYGINPDAVGTTMRSILEGDNIFDIEEDANDIDVIVTITPGAKKDINSLLNIPVANSARFLISLRNVVDIKEVDVPRQIERLDGKRFITLHSGLHERRKKDNDPRTNDREPRKKDDTSRKNDSEPGKNDFASAQDGNSMMQRDKKPVQRERITMTPLEAAEYLEREVFPVLIEKYPTAEFTFDGEVKDSRESGADFRLAIILVILIIYVILALTLNSLVKPFIIMLSIPFGFVGIVLALQAHGMLTYGFFSIIGALGLAGVVVNDSIVMLVKLEKEYHKTERSATVAHRISEIAKTRLRAVILTTLTTVAGLLPTAYGICGYDSMLAEMMLAMAWGLIFGTVITLILVPSLYCVVKEAGVVKRRILKQN